MRFGFPILGRLIGCGKHGNVYEFLNKNKKYIIKIFDKPNKNIDKEIFIQQIASDAGIAPKILSYTKDYIVMEYIEGNTLEEYSEEDIHKLYNIINKTVDKLHNEKIRHNDLTPGNFIITKKGNKTYVYIIDYGSSEYDEDFEDEDFEDDYPLF